MPFQKLLILLGKLLHLPLQFHLHLQPKKNETRSQQEHTGCSSVNTLQLLQANATMREDCVATYYSTKRGCATSRQCRKPCEALPLVLQVWRPHQRQRQSNEPSAQWRKLISESELNCEGCVRRFAKPVSKKTSSGFDYSKAKAIEIVRRLTCSTSSGD